MMLQRPKPAETEDDLLKQDEAFRSGSQRDQPSTNVSGFGKRKTDEVITNEKISKPKSKFAEKHSKKKKKGVTDNTTLKEAVASNEEKTAVLSSIIERNVPSLSPLLMQWNPSPMPHGFPQAPKIDIVETKDLVIGEDTAGSSKKKSLYLKQLEKEGMLKRSFEEAQTNKIDVDDERVSALGNESYILDGRSGLGKVEEAEIIHSENISRISSMSHEERLKERNELISKLTPDQVNFLRSLRSRREQSKNDSQMDHQESHIDIHSQRDVNPTSPLSHFDDQKHLSNLVNDAPVLESGERKVSSDNNESLPLSELPIPIEEAKKWIHMDKVEIEKLKWMTGIPKPLTLKGKEGFTARFNFEGDLLPYDSDISWRQGLHHHGEEPGRPGYTLDELFVFVRSQVVQQRHLGLKTIANILRNANEGLYDTCFDTPIIQLMIDAGIILLLRFAIDEATALVYQEALRALYFLVACEPDERCLNISEPWMPLGVQPGFSSRVHSKEKGRKELDSEEKELKDIEVIKLDVIRALIRMDVHIRFRYLLESVTLSSLDVIHILGVLKRIARHSLTSAWTLVKTPRLIATIVEHFLPFNTSSLLYGKSVKQLPEVYGIPLYHALSFMKVLASRGRQIGSTVAETYDLMPRIMAYVSLEPTEVKLPMAEVLNLAQEAYSLWSVLLSYGLSVSQQAFSSFYPLFVRQLIFYRDKVDLNNNIESNQYNYEIGAHMANVLTRGLCVAATKSLLTNRMKNKESSVRGADGKEVVLQPPSLDWNEFREVIPLVEIVMVKWVNQFITSLDVSFSGLKLLGSFCNFLSAFLLKWRDQPSFEGDAFVRKMETILTQIIYPLLREDVRNFLLRRMRECSALCSSLKPGNCREPINLGSLWSVCEGGELTPVLRKESLFPLLFPLTNLLKNICTLCSVVDSEAIASLLNCKLIKSYLREFCTSHHSLREQWFSRVEVYSLANILIVASLKGCDDRILYHQTALILLPLIHKGDDHIIKGLLSDVICNVDFVQDLAGIETQIDALTMKEYKPLKSPAISQPIISPVELTKKLLSNLPSVGQSLVKNLLYSTLLEESLVRYSCVSFLINTLTVDRQEEASVLDNYWCLAPLKFLLNLNERGGIQNQGSPPEVVISATRCLQMTFLYLKHRKGSIASHTNLTGWFRHLSNLYLSSSDLFLDVSVSSYTQASLIAILDAEAYKQIDPKVSLPGMPPCFEWYKSMLDQFGSVSYGDSSFALFIVIPLMRHWPSTFRLSLFGEHEAALQFIRLNVQEVCQFIPLESFISPIEADENVIVAYTNAMRQQFISEKRTPFLFHIASYHVRNYKEK